MRLIDADAYKAEMYVRQEACGKWYDSSKVLRDTVSEEYEELVIRAEQAYATFMEAALVLDKLPTIETAPVVHGRWKHRKTWDRVVCDRCSFENNAATKYCPNCGARMNSTN